MNYHTCILDTVEGINEVVLYILLLLLKSKYMY